MCMNVYKNTTVIKTIDSEFIIDILLDQGNILVFYKIYILNDFFLRGFQFGEYRSSFPMTKINFYICNYFE